MGALLRDKTGIFGARINRGKERTMDATGQGCNHRAEKRGADETLETPKRGAACGTGGDHRQVLRLYVLPRRWAVGLPDTDVPALPICPLQGRKVTAG